MANIAPNLGFITKKERTNDQHDAHALAESSMARFTLPYKEPQANEKVMLSDFWHAPEVVADAGYNFDRSPFHQLTGSCVGAGGGNALFSLIAVQRMIADQPTKAILPFWPFMYGRCRANEGDRGQGEGAMGSSFADTCVKEGVLDVDDCSQKFTQDDGLVLTERLEMQWSDGNSSLVTGYSDKARKFPLGSAAPIQDVQGIVTAVRNGYPGSFACDNYIGNASVTGSGANAAICGRWNGNGGHQQWFFGYWNNPDLGLLIAVGNNWPRDTYPQDPAGLPLVTCWVKEKDVTAAFRLDAEVYAFSHLTYFPAQSKVLDWLF